jgi:cytochrome c oxidase assembly protein subunit 15
LLFFFGLFQAFVGWWMVKSGLSNDPYVSSYRLAFHLTNAVIILSILLWLTLNSWEGSNFKFYPKNYLEIILFLLFFFVFFTIISGAFMSGTNAGKSFNTYPLMNGELIPSDYFLIDNKLRNFFENTVAINFNHRWMATTTFVALIIFSIYLKFFKKIKNQNLGSFLILLFVTFQFFLGVLTLITNVKIVFASLHQINSILLLSSMLYTYHSIKKS